MKVVQSIAIILILFLMGQPQARIVNTGKGLPHAKSADVLSQGHMTTMGNMRFWVKRASFTDPTLKIETGTSIWVVQALANITYGFSKHGEVSLTPILYQDAHKLDGEEIPWDTFLHIKFGKFKVERQPFWLGFELGTRFPTGKNHNVIFEDYTAGKFEFGVMGMLTYRYSNPRLRNDFRIHTNLGYWNYNDSGKQLMEEPSDERGYVDGVSQSMQYAVGIDFPTRLYEYGLELYGLAWLVAPPLAAASRENYLFMNVSFMYKPTNRISVFSNADLRLTPASDTSDGFAPELPGMPSYPGWRINIGMKYLLLPKSNYDLQLSYLEREQRAKTRKLFSQLEEEMAKIEESKQELERLKKEKAELEAAQ